jgi:hypothetical protein
MHGEGTCDGGGVVTKGGTTRAVAMDIDESGGEEAALRVDDLGCCLGFHVCTRGRSLTDCAYPLALEQHPTVLNDVPIGDDPS